MATPVTTTPSLARKLTDTADLLALASTSPAISNTSNFPTLSISSTRVTEGVDSHAIFKLDFDQASEAATVIDLSLIDGSATGGGVDYGSNDASNIQVSYDNGVTWANATSVTMPANTISALVRVAIVSDNITEADETFTLNAIVTNYNTSATGTATIVDNVVVTPTITITDATEIEGKTLNHTVTLSSASTTATTFAFSLKGVTATADVDFSTTPTFTNGVTYDASTGKITVPANTTSFTVSYTTVDDKDIELTETTALSIDGVNAVGTITDNDVATTPVVSINSVTITEGSDKYAVFTLSLDKTSKVANTFTLALADITATGKGVDYGSKTTTNIEVSTNDGKTWVKTTSATIAANKTSVLARTPIIDDKIDENNETFTLTATRTKGDTSNGSATGTATIVDNDATPSLSINDVKVDESAGTMTFTVKLSAASGLPVSVDYSTSDAGTGAGYATAGSDYTAKTGTINFAANETSKTITIAITDDKDIESDEVFNVNLSKAVNATISDNLGVGTIIDNDNLSKVSIDSVTVTEGTDKYAVFTLSLDKTSKVANTFTLALADVTATGKGIDYGSKLASNIEVSTDGGKKWVSATSATIAANTKSVLVRTAIIDDKMDENDETFTLTATRTSGNTTNASVVGTATIKDNDNAPSISINDVKVDESAGTMTFTVKLSAASGLPVSVDYSTSDAGKGAGYATAGSDYTAKTGTINFAAGQTSQTITVAIKDDNKIEGDEIFNVNLSNAVNATISDKLGVGTIEDNDKAVVNPVTISIEDAGTHIEGSILEFKVTLSEASTETITVKYTTKDGDGIHTHKDNIAIGGDDYDKNSGTITFLPGDTVAYVQINTIVEMGEFIKEYDEYLRVVLSSPTGNATIADDTGTGGIDEQYETPLILDLNGDGVQSMNITAGVVFDHNVNGRQEHTGWVEKNDGLLAIDLNHDGVINNGREIFGNNTLLADGSKAKDGFEALAQYDSNQDGKIDTQDAIYKDLVVWKDADSDGQTDTGELSGLAQNGVSSLNLGWISSDTNVEDNRHTQVGSFTDTQGNSHEMTDVWFKVSEGAETFTWSLNDHGQSGTPTINHIESFNVASTGDKLDMRDLLQGETKASLESYLHFEKLGADTILHVSSTGSFDANQQAVGATFAHNVEDKTIVIEHVDLIGNMSNDHQVIQNLLAKGTLIID